MNVLYLFTTIPMVHKGHKRGGRICRVIFLAENPADNAEVISPDYFLQCKFAS
jgi:hypothetical protein